jgi:hypothetical protein
MKKILSYLIIMTAGGLFAACSLNDAPEFDDANAFVAFEKTAISVDENAGTLRVGVRLTSLGGLTSTVAYQIFNGTAQEDVDFEPTGGSSVLTFSAETPVQYIEFNILEHPGLFTGDRSFGIKLTNGGDVALGAADSTAITVLDLDHPLSFILGNYSGTGIDGWDFTPYSWSGVVFEKDADDVSKIWIRKIFEATGATAVYGIVNEEKTELTLQMHQITGTVSGYNAYLEGAEIPFAMLESSDRLTFTISTAGVTTISLKGDYEMGIGAYNASTEAFAGWFERYSEVVFTKQ